DKRAGAIEVLRVRQQVKELGRGAGPLGARQQAVGEASLGIGLGRVGEREQIDRKENVEELQRVARRLAEAVIERSSTGAADRIEAAVEDLAPLLVGVESLIQEVAQEAPALRDAPADREPKARRRVGGRRVVLQKAHEIARAREPAAEHLRIF